MGWRGRIGGGRRGRIAACAGAALLAGACVTAAVALAAVGDLTQKPGQAGCFSAEDTGGACADGVALDGANSVAVSPDGASAYVASLNSRAVAIFDRAPDGTLTQKPGTAGCISEDGSGDECADGRALIDANTVAVSPDGASVYVASEGSNAVAVFDRAADGTLTQKGGEAACVSEDGSGGDCANGRALVQPRGMTVSPDGASVYVASSASNAVAVFDRAADGTLTQKAGQAGCVSADGTGGDCAVGVALGGAHSVTVSPGGDSVYAGASTDPSMAVFDRAPDGTLTQKAGQAGCVSDAGTGDGCVELAGFLGPASIALSPDGASLYTANVAAIGVWIFDRSPDGAVVKKEGAAGCIKTATSGADCVVGVPTGSANSIALSPDGLSAYTAASFGSALAIFDRAPDGSLTQKPSPAGCISEDGSGGDCTDGVALGDAISVAVSPDGISAYATSLALGAVTIFDREVPPPPPPPSCPQIAISAAKLKVNVGSGRGARAPGARLRLRAVPGARVQLSARLRYRLEGKPRIAKLGRRTVVAAPARQLRLQLPAKPRRKLRAGQRVTLVIGARARPLAPVGCPLQPERTLRLQVRAKRIGPARR